MDTTPIQTISEITVTHIDGMQMGNDRMIAGAAWVSTNAEEALAKANDPDININGVLNYLISNSHGSPFEHGAITVYVHAPIKVFREWHRHRIGFSYNEESGRYTRLKPVFYIPSPDRPMFKVDNWKPGRPKFLTIPEEAQRRIDIGLHHTWDKANEVVFDDYKRLCSNLTRSYELAYAKYEENLAMGFDPGLARDELPVGIYSSQWVTANPRSIMSFLKLRVYRTNATFPSYPLWEIEVAAEKFEAIFQEYWPITHELFNKHGRVAP